MSHVRRAARSQVSETEVFWDFVRERDAVRQRREEGAPPPWTSDCVLRERRFSNVHRDDDLRSQELYAECVGNPRDEVIVNVILCRLLSRVAYSALGWQQLPVDTARMRAMYDDYRARHAPFFDGASTTPTYTNTLLRGGDTMDRFLRAVRGWEQWAQREHCLASLREWFEELHALPGMGPYHAWQVAADLAYTHVAEACSRDEWAYPGPGAWSGLREMWPSEFVLLRKDGSGKKCGLAPPDAKRAEIGVTRMLSLLNEQPSDMARSLTLIDIEHSLCEFAKYRRYSRGDVSRALV